jgi:anti-sigma regulatory factor (Ser/Thr protein kinase)
MDALLTDEWLAGLDAVPTIDEASAALARELVRARGGEAGLPREEVERLAIAASELVTNQLRHARRGKVAVRAIERSGVRGVEIVAADLGSGIADVQAALAGTGPSARSLGSGVASARRMVHELDVDVRLGQGTALWARAFAEAPLRRREVGVVGRPIAEERVSGDHAVVLRDGATLLCAVIDGIGHGPLAWEAAERAGATVRAHRHASLTAILEACDAALVGTRGAVMSVARIDEATGTLEHAGVGNVTARIEGRRRTKLLGSASWTLGRRGSKLRTVMETVRLDDDEALVLFTDGLVSRASLEESDMLREHPAAIAQHLVERFARTTDDALALVVK